MRRIATLTALVTALVGFTASALADTWQVDTVHSSVLFNFDRMEGVSTFWGRFNDLQGTIDPNAGKVELTIDAGSVYTGNKKRDDHLRSPDFFDVKQFPKWTFKATEVKKTGEGTYEAKGDLTAHGVTRPLTVTVKQGKVAQDPQGKTRTGFETQFAIKRSEFGMSTMLGPIADTINVIIVAEGVK